MLELRVAVMVRTFLATVSAAVAGGVAVGILDVLLALRRAGEPTSAHALALALLSSVGLYSGVAVGLGFVLGVVAGSIHGVLPPRAMARTLARLSSDRALDRDVAAGVLAAAVVTGVIVVGVFVFALLFGLEMANKRNGALSTALVAAALVLPAALAWFPAWLLLRAMVRVLPRPRTAWAIGLCALVGAAAVVAAVLSVDWRIIDFGPALAAHAFVLLGVGHFVVWNFGPGARAMERLGTWATVAAPSMAVVAASILFATTLARFGDEPRSLALVGEETWGARPILRVLRRGLDHDHDGFAARLGGGDCDDHDPRRNPAASDEPGNGIDEDCDGSDAPLESAEAAPDPAPVTPTPAPAPGPATPGARPAGALIDNLLVITVDTLRADRVDPRIMPALSRLADEGTRFSRAYAQAPNTPRSFPSFLTSRYPSRVKWDRAFANFPPMSDDNLTLFEVLRAMGFHTVGEFSHFYAEPRSGIAQGFDEWHNDGALSLHDSNTDSAAPRITARLERRLHALKAGGRRFALWTHFFEPHSRYMEHPGIAVHGSGFANLESKYDGECTFVDQHIARVLKALAAEGLDGSTTVVVIADHGESFGEHRLGGQQMFFHGETLFDEALRVPMVIRVPGRPARTVDTRVELLDLAPTLVELAGGVVPASFQGRSLAAALRGGEIPPRPVYAELLPAPSWNHNWRVLIDGDLKLVAKTSEGTTELYDLASDPGEQHNLALARPADVLREKDALRRFPPSAPSATNTTTAALPGARPGG